MLRDGEHSSMCFLAIWTSSFEKALFNSFAHFFIESLIFGSLVFWAPCILWLSVPCLMYSWQIFFHSVDGLFNLKTISFVVQKIYKFL
jgi:hypothetical protein